MQLRYGPLTHYTQIEPVSPGSIWVSRYEAGATKMSVLIDAAWLDNLPWLLEAQSPLDSPPDPSPEA